MQTDAKVVPLNKGGVQPSAISPEGRLPVALIQVRDKAALLLSRSLQTLFDNVDDSLFGMADRATSNAEQSVLFEAMRDLRLRRKVIERTFLQKVLESFSALNRYEIGREPQLGAVSIDSLSLVHNDELEETVAMDAMVAKVMSRDALALSHLTTRFNVLIGKKIDERGNPIGPRLLCESFLSACRALEVEIRVKLIVLKLFEKHVLADLEPLYAEANQSLVMAGVLPDLHAAPVPRPVARPRGPERSAHVDGQGVREDTPSDEGVQEVFGALQALLSQARGTSLPRQELPADAVPVSGSDLMRLLSHLQSLSDRQGEHDPRAALDQLLSRASARSGRTRVVGEADDDVINLVSMLFEFILDDRTLPDSLKALIARMQIPMLKVALLDKTFFSRSNHPARRLLNEIASAALGWMEHDEARRDSLHQRIEQVVLRLLNDFVDDPAIFSDLLAEFLAYVGDERRRSELLEQRIRDAEEGRAKAELARRQVEGVLNQRLLGRTLPEVVVRLLREAWSQVLLLICLKHDMTSAEWQAAVETMDELIWSVEPREDEQAGARLLERLPNLLQSLREGLADAAFDPFVGNEFFRQLEALHVRALKRGVVLETPEVPLADGAALPPALSEKVDEALVVVVLEEVVLVASGEFGIQEPEADLPDDHEALGFVDNLRVGSWVEFQEDEEHKLRCKLAALVKPTGKYIFVNRTGMKVLEKTRMGLAMEFYHHSIRLLDDALLFDRALESVIGNLRRLKGT